MTHVVVVGGGPAGLSAALFTAKNGLDTTLFDTDKTWMHKAHLYNYLGIESRDGTQFMEDSREQVDEYGVDRRQGEAVTDVAERDGGFTVTTEDGAADWRVELVETPEGPMLALTADRVEGELYYLVHEFADNGTHLGWEKVTEDELPPRHDQQKGLRRVDL